MTKKIEEIVKWAFVEVWHSDIYTHKDKDRIIYDEHIIFDDVTKIVKKTAKEVMKDIEEECYHSEDLGDAVVLTNHSLSKIKKKYGVDENE